MGKGRNSTECFVFYNWFQRFVLHYCLPLVEVVFCLLFDEDEGALLLALFLGPFKENLIDVELFLLLVPDDCFRLLGLLLLGFGFPLMTGIDSLENDVEAMGSVAPADCCPSKRLLELGLFSSAILIFSSGGILRETVFRGTVVDDFSSFCASIKFRISWRSWSYASHTRCVGRGWAGTLNSPSTLDILLTILGPKYWPAPTFANLQLRK